MAEPKTGKVIIFCAPSGSGKTTIVKHLLQTNQQLMFSVSACTRKRREGEVDGKDYYFLTREEFQRHINENDFLEYEEVYGGNFYGTLKKEIDRIWSQGKVVLFDVDVEGGLTLKNYFGEQALVIFVMPPSVEVLEQRLRDRSTETEETLQVRLNKAIKELEYKNRFGKQLLNDQLSTTLVQAESMVNEFLTQG